MRYLLILKGFDENIKGENVMLKKTISLAEEGLSVSFFRIVKEALTETVGASVFDFFTDKFQGEVSPRLAHLVLGSSTDRRVLSIIAPSFVEILDDKLDGTVHQMRIINSGDYFQHRYDFHFINYKKKVVLITTDSLVFKAELALKETASDGDDVLSYETQGNLTGGVVIHSVVPALSVK
jgi:hypothetical protein